MKKIFFVPLILVWSMSSLAASNDIFVAYQKHYCDTLFKLNPDLKSKCDRATTFSELQRAVESAHRQCMTKNHSRPAFEATTICNAETASVEVFWSTKAFYAGATSGACRKGAARQEGEKVEVMN